MSRSCINLQPGTTNGVRRGLTALFQWENQVSVSLDYQSWNIESSQISRKSVSQLDRMQEDAAMSEVLLEPHSCAMRPRMNGAPRVVVSLWVGHSPLVGRGFVKCVFLRNRL
jgi:hypothetical protein